MTYIGYSMPSPPPLEGKKGTARGGLSRRRAISAPAGKKGSAPGGLKPPAGYIRPCGEEGRGKEAFSACCGGGKKRCRRLFPCLRPCRRAEHAAWRRNKRSCAWLWRNPPGRMRGRRCGPVALIRIGKRGRSPCRIFPSRRAAGGERRRGRGATGGISAGVPLWIQGAGRRLTPRAWERVR